MLVLMAAVNACGALLEDFESFSVTLLNGQGNWSASSTVRVVRDINTDNKMMQLIRTYANAYKSLDSLAIPDGQTGTLFFRFQSPGNVPDETIGLSDVASPSDWSHYEPTTRIYPDTGGNVKAQGRNFGSYQDMSLNGGANGLAPETWYHMWMVCNNATDTVDFYIHGGGITNQRLVATEFGFRNGTTDPLITFLAKSGTLSTVSSLFVDDVYVSPGVNLNSPIGDPASSAVDLDAYDRTAIGLDLPSLFEFAGQRLKRTNDFIPAGSMPERTYSGYWNETTAWGWTSGFYAGQLWKMYRQTGDAYYLNAATSRTADLKGIETYGGDHDIGFRVFNSFGEGYKSLPDSDPDRADYLNRILVAADTLAGRYRPVYQAIESWGGNQVIIDNMMNLELLFWAAENTSDPVAAQRWYDIAVNHATTSRREHVRPDGSTYHVVKFDGTTGEVVDKYTAQGYADESTWSRGQSWGLYGFTVTYRFTQDQSFLDTAVQLAEYWLAHMPADGLVPYDFDDPDPNVPLDTSAAAIASCALLELMEYVDPTDAQRYFDAAETMLTGLSSLEALTNGLDHGLDPYGGFTRQERPPYGTHLW